MIYAFKKKGIEQTLEDHIELCLETFERIKGTRLWRNLNLDERLVRYMIIYHDIGKVLYQRYAEELSFPGHEFISAYVFWKVFGRNLSKEEELMLLAPIIYHHHAMGVKKRLEDLNERKITKPNDEILNELEDILAKYLDRIIVSETIDAIRSIEILKVKRKIRDKIDEIWRKFHGEFARKFLGLLMILIVCDYEGSKNRGKTTGFGKIVEEFLGLLFY